MILEIVPAKLTVCKVKDAKAIDMTRPFTFAGCTDEELSLVCPEEYAPADTVVREDGWRAFRIQGTLDFALTGILAKIAAILAEAKIGIFAVSTYNTDYILVKEENFRRALDLLCRRGYEIAPEKG